MPGCRLERVAPFYLQSMLSRTLAPTGNSNAPLRLFVALICDEATPWANGLSAVCLMLSMPLIANAIRVN